MLIREERKRSSRAVVLLLVLAVFGILGNLLGIFLGAVIPDGPLQESIAQPIPFFGFSDPITLDLWVISLSFGLTLKLNACGFFSMIIGLFVYKMT